MNALANPEVGKFVNEYFVSAFQKVATFKIVGNAKQGGNVATYFCAPDGRVLHIVAGPVNANQMLHEAKWVVETAKTAMKEAKDDGAKFKAFFRKAHSDKLRQESGVIVEALTYDPPDPKDDTGALTYRDPTGRTLAPKLPPPPIQGPDVKLQNLQDAARNAPGNMAFEGKSGGRVWMGTQGTVDHLLAAHAMAKIETVYGTVFENILGEKISTKPVEVTRPFSWRNDGKQVRANNNVIKN